MEVLAGFTTPRGGKPGLWGPPVWLSTPWPHLPPGPDGKMAPISTASACKPPWAAPALPRESSPTVWDTGLRVGWRNPPN